MGYLELLDDPTEAEAYRSHVDTIRVNAHHLLHIINDILDLSKIEAGRVEFERIPMSPVGLTRDVPALMQARVQSQNIDLNVCFETNVPTSFESDLTRVRQILLNRVGNAIKFTEIGEVTIRIAWDSGVAPAIRRMPSSRRYGYRSRHSRR